MYVYIYRKEATFGIKPKEKKLQPLHTTLYKQHHPLSKVVNTKPANKTTLHPRHMLDSHPPYFYIATLCFVSLRLC